MKLFIKTTSKLQSYGVVAILMIGFTLTTVAQQTVNMGSGTPSTSCDSTGGNTGITTDLNNIIDTAVNTNSGDVFSLEAGCGIKYIQAGNSSNIVEIVSTNSNLTCIDFSPNTNTELLYGAEADGDIWEVVTGLKR